MVMLRRRKVGRLSLNWDTVLHYLLFHNLKRKIIPTLKLVQFRLLYPILKEFGLFEKHTKLKKNLPIKFDTTE